MRKLALKDVFTMSRIITKMNINDELKKFVEIYKQNEKNSQNQSDEEDLPEYKLDIGIDMVLTILSKVSDRKVEREIYDFIADVLEKKAEEVENGDPTELIDELTKSDGVKEWKNFFARVVQLIFRQ